MNDAEMLEADIINFLEGFTAKKGIEPEQWIGRDIGIHGGDGLQILLELEERFEVDLNPLMEANASDLRPSWFDQLRGRKHGPAFADVTVRQLIDYIANNATERR